MLELLYVALGTIGILFVLHLGTFWVARILQPPKPKVVYLPAPTPAPAPAPLPPPPPPPPPALSQAPQTIQLPTYESPRAPEAAPPASAPMGSLPPPIETRSTVKQSSGDMGAPR